MPSAKNTEPITETETEEAVFFNFKEVDVNNGQTFIVEGANKNIDTGSLIVWTDQGMISFYSAKYESYTNGFHSLKKQLITINEELKTDIDFCMTLRDNIGDILIHYTKVESKKSKTGYAHRWTIELANE